MQLSTVIPVRNEQAMAGEIVRRVERVLVDAEIIVDDCSTGDTAQQLSAAVRVRYVRRDINRGKGAALRATPGELTPKARRSPGATACARCGASPEYNLHR